MKICENPIPKAPETVPISLTSLTYRSTTPGRRESVLFRAQMPDASSLPFLGAGLNTHDLGKEGPRKLVVRQYHQISAVANRYGGRQSSKG